MTKQPETGHLFPFSMLNWFWCYSLNSTSFDLWCTLIRWYLLSQIYWGWIWLLLKKNWKLCKDHSMGSTNYYRTKYYWTNFIECPISKAFIHDLLSSNRIYIRDQSFFRFSNLPLKTWIICKFDSVCKFIEVEFDFLWQKLENLKGSFRWWNSSSSYWRWWQREAK